MTGGCEHRNVLLPSRRCTCVASCFCRTLGVCRDSAMSPTPPRTVTPPAHGERSTDKMDPLVASKRLEIDLDNPNGVAEFLDAVAESIRKRGRIVLIIE